MRQCRGARGKIPNITPPLHLNTAHHFLPSSPPLQCANATEHHSKHTATSHYRPSPPSLRCANIPQSTRKNVQNGIPLLVQNCTSTTAHNCHHHSAPLPRSSTQRQRARTQSTVWHPLPCGLIHSTRRLSPVTALFPTGSTTFRQRQCGVGGAAAGIFL